MGDEIMDQTKTGADNYFLLPQDVMDILREHANSLDGVMEDSEYLFPSVLGGLRARSVLDKPFQEVTAALGWKLHLTPRAMRRTFKNIARNRGVSKFIVKKISGHSTDQMHEHYSTAELAEIHDAISRVAAVMRPPPKPKPAPTDTG